MPIEITMPRLSDTMEQGTIVAWNVKEGDEVSAGDVLGDIETDKATMELQNFDDGTVAHIALGEGETVGVGSVIMVLAEEGEDPAEVKKQAESGASASSSDGDKTKRETPETSKDASGDGSSGQREQQQAGAATATANGDGDDGAGDRNGAGRANGVASRPGSVESNGGRIFASPLARKIAAERGLDLASIQGSGPSGRIIKRDVESAGDGAATRSAERPAAPAARTPIPETLESRVETLSNMRATIAKRLVESKTTIPHYQVTVTVRMDALLGLRKQLNEQLATQGVKLSVNDFLVRACALAMHEHPHVNASWGDDGKSIQLHGRVNVGVAIALPEERGGGLVVATLRDTDRTGLRQISADTKALAEKARGKGLTIDEMSDSTFTISNLGMFGVEHFNAIINPPNSAILADGGAVRKPVVNDETNAIEVGHEMQMTMSSDHRVIDGAMAAQYLATVKQMLEHPATLLV